MNKYSAIPIICTGAVLAVILAIPVAVPVAATRLALHSAEDEVTALRISKKELEEQLNQCTEIVLSKNTSKLKLSNPIIQ